MYTWTDEYCSLIITVHVKTLWYIKLSVQFRTLESFEIPNWVETWLSQLDLTHNSLMLPNYSSYSFLTLKKKITCPMSCHLQVLRCKPDDWLNESEQNFLVLDSSRWDQSKSCIKKKKPCLFIWKKAHSVLKTHSLFHSLTFLKPVLACEAVYLWIACAHTLWGDSECCRHINI